MDPNANLREQLQLAHLILEADENHDDIGNGMSLSDAGSRLAELVEALDEWIRKGGFLPGTWRGLSARRTTR